MLLTINAWKYWKIFCQFFVVLWNFQTKINKVYLWGECWSGRNAICWAHSKFESHKTGNYILSRDLCGKKSKCDYFCAPISWLNEIIYLSPLWISKKASDGYWLDQMDEKKKCTQIQSTCKYKSNKLRCQIANGHQSNKAKCFPSLRLEIVCTDLTNRLY